MNRISRHIIVAFSAVVTLVSCAKEAVVEPEGSGLLPQGQTREIAVSFGESTKTVLGSTIDETYHKYKPAFCVGDRIKVSNATRSEDCVVADDGGVLKIFTNLEGELTAIYPASAANVTGNASIPATNQFKISTTQTGKFSDANICKATIPAESTAASFVNQTALLRFYVDESIGVEKITITGTADIATGGGKTITVDPDGTALISTVTEDPDKRLCYVAILPGTNTLTFESVTTVQGQGTVTRKMKENFNYTKNGIFNGFLPYYIKIKVSSSPDVYQKWAYCNIGAFLPEEAGRYFMWGETTGMALNSDNTFTFPNEKYYTAENYTWDKNTGFSWKNCPWTNGTYSDSNKKVFTKYTVSADYAKNSVDNKTVLELEDDAAYVNWGKNWRMPTGGTASTADYTILTNACKVDGYTSGDFAPTFITSEPESKGVYFYNISGSEGFYFVDADGNKLFFPAASGGTDRSTNIYGDYFSSSLSPSIPTAAFSFFFNQVKVEPQNNDCGRRYGRSIRPIYKDPTDLEIKPYDDDDVIIK